jgi:hypothetical protein
LPYLTHDNRNELYPEYGKPNELLLDSGENPVPLTAVLDLGENPLDWDSEDDTLTLCDSKDDASTLCDSKDDASTLCGEDAEGY